MFNTVGVTFVGQNENNTKEYAYLTDIPEIEVGDYVVVDSTDGYKTAKVTTLFCEESKAVKWVVCKIDIKAFEEKLEDLKRKQFILKQMKQRLDRVNILQQFELAAKSDPKMAELLNAFNSKPTKELAE